jgi:VanZ family protein
MLPDHPAPRPTGQDASPPAVRRASPLARGALLVYVVLLVYGSLSPWTGWRSLGVGPFAYLWAPRPAYVTGFDLGLNVLAYLPLGLLLSLALHPRLRGAAAVAASVVLATAVSVLLESLQSYLPVRIASNLDVLTNAAGALAGAVAGALLAPWLIDGRRLQQARRRWFRAHTAAVLLLVALWPLAQLHPAPMLFGNGQLSRDFVSALLALLDRELPVFDASQFAVAEVLVTACGMLGAGAALVAGMTLRAPRRRLLLLLVAAALAAKSIAYGHQFGPDRALAWLTPGALGGVVIGTLAVVAAAASRSARAGALMALAALVALVIAVNSVPLNPYHADSLAGWRPGRMRDVAAAYGWLATAWPFAMLAALAWSLRTRPRRRRRPGGEAAPSASP